MKNHNHPFPSSFRAGVENKVVALLLFLSHIAKEQGALVSSIMEQYAHNATSLVQNALDSCIAGSSVQIAYRSQLRLVFAAAIKALLRCHHHWHQGP